MDVVTGAALNAMRDNFDFLKGDDAWTLPVLLNGWTAYASPYFGPRFKLVGKVCKMVGLTSGGTVSTTPATGAIFVLPAGYRPPERMTFAVISNSAFGRVDVLDTTGQVVAYTGSSTWFSLAGVTFPVL